MNPADRSGPGTGSRGAHGDLGASRTTTPADIDRMLAERARGPMRLPERHQLADVIHQRLSPCLNEHTAHSYPIGPVAGRAVFGVTCGTERLATQVLPAGEFIVRLSSDQVEQWFDLVLTRHFEDCWYQIARTLLEDTE